MVFVFNKSHAFHLSRWFFVLNFNTTVDTCQVASFVEGVYDEHEGGEIKIVGDNIQDFGDASLGIKTGLDTVPQNTLKGKCVNWIFYKLII